MKTSEWVCAGAIGVMVALGAAAAQAESLLIEAEDFQFIGDWTAEREDAGASNGKILRTIASQTDAVTIVTLPVAGEYKLWVRSRDYTEIEPGKRRFKLVVDDVEVPREAGAHGNNGYAWDLVDTRQLAAGDHVVALRDTAKFYPRADAVLFTTEAFNPNERPIRELAKHRVTPKQVDATPTRQFPRPAAVDEATLRDAATIESDAVRVTFRSGTDANGKPVVVRRMEVNDGGAWREAPVRYEDEALFLLHSPDSGLVSRTYYPSWSSGQARLTFEFDGKRYETSAGKRNPFWASEPQLLVPRGVRSINGRSAEVRYEGPSGEVVKALWSLEPGRKDVKVELSYQAAKDGDYSFGFNAFRAWEKDEVAQHLLSPMFNFQRLPQGPSMTLNTVSPHALALLEPRGDQAWALGVAAEPAMLPMEWPGPDNGRYGFSLLNADERVQPTVFQPVLGGIGSKVKAGDVIRVAWRVLAVPGDWKDGLEYASSAVFGVTDYREPTQASLTDAALNMVELIKDDWASGWEPKLKGYYNIEAVDVVSQSAPLAVVSAAVLTGDEELWAKRALPTIEFTLSRPSAHFATAVPETFPSYVNEHSIQLKTPSDFYGTAYWQGLHALLGEANPWIAKLALPGGEVRHRKTNASPRWSELLAAYRLDPTPQRLAEVQREADAWIEKEFNAGHTNYLGMAPFYNMSFYPYWWDLIDLYELTNEKRYLDAAEEGAFHTIAGQWSQPTIAERLTLHPGGEFKGNDHMWWRGTEKYRLGFPRRPGDTPERTVDGWVVSNIGLSFEQPSTFFGGGSGLFQMIMMNNFTPHLLRVYAYTGRDVYRTYARNGIVGRFANYPGYYQRGYTDLMLGPRYPYDGPDVTSIYYHHIPCHLLFTLDWLVTDAQVRSNGAIRFPYGKQQGYVWFVNRVFGGPTMLGEVFGDKGVRLMLDRERVAVGAKAINHLMGRSAERVWVILTNDAKRDVTASVMIDAQALGVKMGEPVRVIDGDGKPLAQRPFASRMEVEVPRGGLVALSLPAEKRDVGPRVPPVENGHVSRPLPGAWKQVQAFRIRGPFGKDALYVVLMGRPAQGASAEFVLEGAEPQTIDAYPYEFSIYPLPMEEDLTFSLRLRGSDGEVTQVEPITLPGTRQTAGAR